MPKKFSWSSRGSTPPLKTAAERRRLDSLSSATRKSFTDNKQAADTRRANESRARRERRIKAGGTAKLKALDSSTAYTVALMLMAGVPPSDIVARIAPTTPLDLVPELARAWMNSEALLAETTKLNGAEWHLLEPDRRLELAADKTLAEMAYFLMSHDFEQADGTELKKLEMARTAIIERLSGQEGRGDAFMQWMDDMVKTKQSFAAPEPAQATRPAAVPPQES